MIQNKQLDQLAKDFVSCAPIQEEMDIVLFASNLAGDIQGVVQYNNEIPGSNISRQCEIMTQPNDPYKNLIQLNKVSSLFTRTIYRFCGTGFDKKAKGLLTSSIYFKYEEVPINLRYALKLLTV